MAELAIAEHYDGFAGLGVFDPRPIRGAEASSQVWPGLRKEMSVNVYSVHGLGALI
jgi:hypothetical protein